MFDHPKLSAKHTVRAAVAEAKTAGAQVEIADTAKVVAGRAATLVEASEAMEKPGEAQVGAEAVRLVAGVEQAMEEAEEAHKAVEARVVTVVTAGLQEGSEVTVVPVAVKGWLVDVGSVATWAVRASICRTNARHHARPDFELRTLCTRSTHQIRSERSTRIECSLHWSASQPPTCNRPM